MSLFSFTLLMTYMFIIPLQSSPVLSAILNRYLIFKNEEKFLMSVWRSGILMANINDNQEIDPNLIAIYNTTSNIVSIEFDYVEKDLLWLEGDVIKKASFNPQFDNYIRIESIEIIVESGVSAFAFDWIHHLTYYWIKNKRQIIVCHITGHNKFKVIINETEQNVGDITIDPISGRIFYSQWDRDERYGQIMSANQDGSDKTDLQEKAFNFEMRKPSSLAIDLVEKKIYIIDTITFRLGSIDYSGNYKTLIEEKDYVKFSRSLDFLRKVIYWPFLKSIYSYLPRSQQYYPKKIIAQQQYIDSIKVWSISRQPNGINRCSDNRCSYLCLPSGPHNYTCVCLQTSNEGECKESTNRAQISGTNMYFNIDTISATIENLLKYIKFQSNFITILFATLMIVVLITICSAGVYCMRVYCTSPSIDKGEK